MIIVEKHRIKREIVYLRPSKTPMPLRFLHLAIGETYEKFKQKHTDVKIGRSKFCALRPDWVREKSTHENCLCLQHANINLLIQVSSELLLKSYLFNFLQARQQRICSEPQDIRYSLSVRQDSFFCEERGFLLEVQVEYHVLSLLTRDYKHDRLFVTCSFQHNDSEQQVSSISPIFAFLSLPESHVGSS